MTNDIPDIFFTFDSLDCEIRRKISSMSVGTARLRRSLTDALHGLLEDSDRTRALELFDSLAALSFDEVYPGYFSHPVRVTIAFALSVSRPLTFDDISLGLCHNMKEVAVKGGERVLAECTSEATRRRIELLTIKRSQQFDEEYLAEYYSAIEHEGGDLLLFKAHDKLDNLLISVCAPESAVHRAVTRNHVVARLQGRYPRCAEYLDKLLAYVEHEENRRRYEGECRCVKVFL